MPIQMHFINVVIPIKKVISIKGKEWWDNYLEKNEKLLGVILWYDDYLLRDGAMDETTIEHIIKFWTEQGFKPKKLINGKEYWNDLCVVDSISGPTFPCDWLKVKYITSKQNIEVVLHVSFCHDLSKDVIGPSR